MTQGTAHFDFETRATVDIKLGVDRYAEHHATQILCLGYKIGSGPTHVWRPLENEPFPQELVDHVSAGGRMVAHNCAFDRTMWNVVLRRSHPYVPEIAIEQTDCTMVRALALGLPGGLDAVCKALKLPITKDIEGYNVMLRLCKPQRRAGQLYWVNDPALFQRLYLYCANDIEAESPIDDLLPRLSEIEQQLWWLSERINQRGIRIDLENVRRCAELVEIEGKSLALAVKQLTRGWANPTQRAKLLDWLDLNGLLLPDMKKHTVRDAMRTELPARIKRVLELQTEANKTSNAKLKQMLQRACDDGRVHSEYLFNGAGTGRWSSRGIQLHNLIRTAKGFKVEHALDIFEWLKHGPERVREIIRREYGSPMLAVSNCIRPLLTVEDGNEFICADYSNIEGRVLAWFASEEWKLDAFRAYDAGTGPDLYKLAFAKAFGVSPDSVDDDQRQVGKVIELSAGYQSGHGGFLAMAAGYDLDLALLAHVVQGQTPAVEWARFEKMYDADGAQLFELERREWTAIKILITKWRDANSNIRTFWHDLDDAAKAAVAEPGKITGVNGKVYFCVADNFLWTRLPSGRRLAYAYPSMGEVDTPWGERKPSVRVFGTDKGRFGPYHLYGGILAENCIAGDALTLTARGWARLDSVRADDLLWDGIDFVSHGGLVAKGVQATVSLDGVGMTPDHRMLTKEGWRNASSCGGLDRADVRLPDSGQLRGRQRQKVAMARYVSVRDNQDGGSRRTEKRQRTVLRMLATAASVRADENARYDQAPGFCGLALDDRPLHATDASSVAQLRRAWDYGLPGMARQVRSVLGGYGSDIPTRTNARPARQYARIHRRELPMGNEQGTGSQQTRKRVYRYALGQDNRGRGRRTLGDRRDHDSLSHQSGLGPAPIVVAPGRAQQVYDIINCGPRNRFVILTNAGPLIVHNCTQALARDILALAMLRLERAGFPIVMHTHDECAAEIPTGSRTLQEFNTIMNALPEWAEGLPISVAGWTGKRYRKG